jgi:arabinofuranosyltransferase
VIASLILLLAHAWAYRFLTDDAFISFRYARNLSHGHGLVFNPGFERVEGYSDFLWVIVLAILDRVGLAPEIASQALGLIATLVLALLVVGFARRNAPRPGDAWIAIVPVFLLAATRSVAVWATSGLETRFFEALIFAATLRLVLEAEAFADRTRRRSLAAWLFALAALTRPDGILIAIAAFTATAVWLALRRRLTARFWVGLVPLVAVVAAQFVFRRLYYGAWLPNTYYAKVGGRLWWSAGASYLAAFALEYAAYLWIPLLLSGLLWFRARGSMLVPLLFASVALPHALYVAAVGGDHFEYRPLDLYFPFVFLLVAFGALAWSRTRAGAAAAALVLALVTIGLWEIPWQSHRQFPEQPGVGFPGLSSDPDAARFLAPERDPIERWPGLRDLANAHRALLGRLSASYIGIRQEEHRAFLESVAPEGRELARSVERGVIPRDVYLAIDCVGAIPYYSGLRILDRRGLTDAAIARSTTSGPRLMAHEKTTTLEEARRRGVDLWAEDAAHVLLPATAKRTLTMVREAMSRHEDLFAAELEGDRYLLCRLPQDSAHAAARMPRLAFRRVDDPRFQARFLALNIAAARDSSSAHPRDPASRQRLAYFLLLDQRYAESRDQYRAVAEVTPDNPFVWESIALCCRALNDRSGESEALAKALELYRTLGDPSGVDRVGRQMLLGRRRADGS